MMHLRRLSFYVFLGLVTLTLLACEAPAGVPAQPETTGESGPSAASIQESPSVPVSPVPLPPVSSGAPAAQPASAPVASEAPAATQPSPTPTELIGPLEPVEATEIDFPWVQDSLSFGHIQETYDSLVYWKNAYPEVYQAIIGLPWITEDITWFESSVVRQLEYIIEGLPPDGVVALAQVISESAWLIDGVGPVEEQYLLLLRESGASPSEMLEELRAQALGDTSLESTPDIDLPWVQDGLRFAEEIETYKSLVYWKNVYPEVFQAMIRLPWISDDNDITWFESSIVRQLEYIIEGLPPDGVVALAQVISKSAWLIDGVGPVEEHYLLLLRESGASPSQMLEELRAQSFGDASLEPTPTPSAPGQESGSILAWTQKSDRTLDELEAINMLSQIARVYPLLVPVLKNFQWLADDITADKIEALVMILLLTDSFPQDDGSLAQAMSEAPWLLDTLTRSEVNYLGSLAMTMNEPGAIIEGIRNAAITETPSSSSSSRPGLGPLVPVTELTWTKDGLAGPEQKALADLQTFDRDYPELAEYVLSYSWVADGITEDEQLALSYLLTIIQGGTQAKLRGSSLPPQAYQQIVDRMPGHHYLMDGITSTEVIFLRDVSELPEQTTMIANFIANEPSQDYVEATPTPAPAPTAAPGGVSINFPWTQDGLNAIEQEVVGYLQSLQGKDEFIAGEVMKAPWLADGIDEGDRRLMCLIATNPEPSTGYAIFLSNSPSTNLPACP